MSLWIAVALCLGALIGWLVARPTTARLQTELEKERVSHSEQLKTWQSAEASFRDAFEALGAQALSRNSEAFLQLAETRLSQARVEAASDVDGASQVVGTVQTEGQLTCTSFSNVAGAGRCAIQKESFNCRIGIRVGDSEGNGAIDCDIR